MSKLRGVPAYQASLTVLTSVVVGVVVITGLYWAQTVLIPIALAVFLAFPLAPLVTRLQRWHLGRKPSVVVVVLFAALALGGVVWVVETELSSLARELPTYTDNIRAKVEDLRQLVHRAGMERLGKFSEVISGEWDNSLASGKAAHTDVEPGSAAALLERPALVPSSQPQGPTWLSGVPALIGSALESIGSFILALVLVVFILLEREVLRNRLIRLLGNGRMTETTKALDDAAERISRYLLMQLAVNGSYGLTWALGLYLIGVDYALLWGFLATVLRYVPYIGAPIAALFPICLSLVQFPGWWQPLAVLGLVLVLELISNNAVEPWLYGQSIGVSAVAMLVAAAFWAFLWGPVGLVLSGPLTVCLVVLGKHVSGLEFLVVLLGDAPALDSDVSFYQRLVARDQDEAVQLVLAHAKTSPPDQVYDELLVPALIYAKRDRAREFLTEADEEFINQTTREVLEDLGERMLATRSTAKMDKAGDRIQSPPLRVHILACPARDHADRLALEMLRQLLNPLEWEVEVTALETLTAELVAHVTEGKPSLVCIGALPPGGLAHTRYLCKKLRARHPDLKIVVGRWGLLDNITENRVQLEEVGADLIATTLLETCKQLSDWLPVLAYQGTKSEAV